MNTHRTIASVLFLALTTGCGLDTQVVDFDGEETPLADDTGFYGEDAFYGEDDEANDDDENHDDANDDDVDLDEDDADDDEPEQEIEEADWTYQSVVYLNLSTHDPNFPSGDIEDTCEGSFTITIDADGVVTGEATCHQVKYANHVSLSLDAEVSGSEIVGDATITYNGRSFDFGIQGLFGGDELYIPLKTSWEPTSSLTQVFRGAIKAGR